MEIRCRCTIELHRSGDHREVTETNTLSELGVERSSGPHHQQRGRQTAGGRTANQVRSEELHHHLHVPGAG